MKISVTTNFDDVARRIDAIGKQAKFAAAVALTRTADDVRTAIRGEMARAFDRPVPYTLNSLFLKGANKNNLEATVWVKDNAFGGGTPADRYLGPQIYSGARQQKKFERMLQRAGVLPAGWYAVPGAGAEIDAHGNMSRGQLVKILAWFQMFGEQGYKKNTTAAGKAKSKRGTRAKIGMEYIVSHGPGSATRGRRQHLPAGIYQRTNSMFGGIQPVLIFVSSTIYRQRLKFFEIGTATAEQRFSVHFDRELSSALRTARPAGSTDR